MEGDGTGEDKTVCQFSSTHLFLTLTMASSQQTEGPAETGEGEQAPHQLATSEEAPTSPQPMEDQGIDHPGHVTPSPHSVMRVLPPQVSWYSRGLPVPIHHSQCLWKTF